MALGQLSLFYLLDEPGPVRVNEGWGRFRFGHVRRERQSPWWDHSATHPSRKSREGWGTPCAVCHRKAGPPARKRRGREQSLPRFHVRCNRCTYNVPRGTWQICTYIKGAAGARVRRTKSENTGARSDVLVTYSHYFYPSHTSKSLIILVDLCCRIGTRRYVLHCIFYALMIWWVGRFSRVSRFGGGGVPGLEKRESWGRRTLT